MPKQQTRGDRAGRVELHYAVIDGNIERVIALLDAGQNPSVPDKDGWTPLHFAAQGNQLEIGRILIKRGTSIDAQDVHGNSPLSRAVFTCFGNGSFILMLREHGANPNLANHHGISPLALALQIANHDVKQFFSDLIGGSK